MGNEREEKKSLFLPRNLVKTGGSRPGFVGGADGKTKTSGGGRKRPIKKVHGPLPCELQKTEKGRTDD